MPRQPLEQVSAQEVGHEGQAEGWEVGCSETEGFQTPGRRTHERASRLGEVQFGVSGLLGWGKVRAGVGFLRFRRG
jgi:hypothetical protein